MLHILFALANYSFFSIEMSVYFLFFICIVFVSLFSYLYAFVPLFSLLIKIWFGFYSSTFVGNAISLSGQSQVIHINVDINSHQPGRHMFWIARVGEDK